MTNEHAVTCPCCGYKTVDEEYDICAICLWEHDRYQVLNPDRTGANQIPLNQAQKNFATFGAKSEQVIIDNRPRARSEDYKRDPDWRPMFTNT